MVGGTVSTHGIDYLIRLQIVFQEKWVKSVKPVDKTNFYRTTVKMFHKKLIWLPLITVFCLNETNQEYRIVHFDDNQIMVSHLIESLLVHHRRLRRHAIHMMWTSLQDSSKLIKFFKAVMNTSEWELNLEFHEFDEPWMRFAKGFDSKNFMIFFDVLPWSSTESFLKAGKKLWSI